MQGEINVAGDHCGSVYITGALCNDITIGGHLGL